VFGIQMKPYFSILSWDNSNFISWGRYFD